MLFWVIMWDLGKIAANYADIDFKDLNKGIITFFAELEKWSNIDWITILKNGKLTLFDPEFIYAFERAGNI